MDDLERFIRYHVTSDDVVIDVGANRGFYAKTFSELAHQVYCMEPHPEVFPILKENLSPLPRNVRLFQLAASERSGTVDFYLDRRPGLAGVCSSISILEGLHEQNMVEKVLVEATTIDRLCEMHRIVPTFIKVDVEGHEPTLFRGASETIRKYRPLFVFEFWEAWWGKGFSQLFTELDHYYHLVRIQDGVNVSQFYRANQGDQAVDIAALPRRRSAGRANSDRVPPRSWLPWFRRAPSGDRRAAAA